MIKKIRFIEPGTHLSYNRDSIKNYFTYNRGIVNPGTGLIILTTIAEKIIKELFVDKSP